MCVGVCVNGGTLPPRDSGLSVMADIEELVDIVLIGQHPRLRGRCIVDRIVSVLENTFGAYDAAGVRIVLYLRIVVLRLTQSSQRLVPRHHHSSRCSLRR